MGPPNSTHSTASLDSFDTAEIQCLPTELREFTNWAFGPHGLPTLEVLAFGDFSYDTSQQIHDKLLLTFRPVRENDRKLWDLIDRNTEFLKACHTDSILDD